MNVQPSVAVPACAFDPEKSITDPTCDYSELDRHMDDNVNRQRQPTTTNDKRETENGKRKPATDNRQTTNDKR
jgi:hypothetical protein